MRNDELAFLNLQLASMLRSGIPLEGALRQLSSTMAHGALKAELEHLEARLASGLPLPEALNATRLPELYRRMLVVGAQSNDLPGVLTLLADHYQRVNSIGTRLQGLMVYPSIVMVACLALSFFLALFSRAFSEDMPRMLNDANTELVAGHGTTVLIWLPVVVLSVGVVLVILVLVLPALRRWLRWHLPGFKEAALAQLASAAALMLRAGTSLTDSLGLLRSLEAQTPAGDDLAGWQRRLAEGHARFPALAAGSKVVPPLFCWLVDSGGENLTEGFQRAAEVYQARASYRVEMLLYAALPVSILFLGVMLVSQAYPVIRLFVQFGSVLDQLGQ